MSKFKLEDISIIDGIKFGGVLPEVTIIGKRKNKK